MSTDATRAGSTGITMLARASSRAAVIRTVPGARPAMAPCGVTAAISVSAECQVTVRYTGQPVRLPSQFAALAPAELLAPASPSLAPVRPTPPSTS